MKTRWWIVSGAVVLALIAVLATPRLLGNHLSEAIETVGSADEKWLWVAGAGFAAAVVAAAGSWRCAIGLAGGKVAFGDACARYGAGSLVNTFVPARAGDAVRFALFARAIPHRKRLSAAGGSFAALGAARELVVGSLFAAGALAGAVPLWPLAVAGGIVALAVLLAFVSRRTQTHFLDAFRTIVREPAGAARLLGWMVLSTLARLLAAAAIAASFGLSNPVGAAIVILPALDVASLVPLTPGNLGVTSGTVALVLKTHGVPFDDGLAAGIAFHAVETAVGLCVGIASLLWLAPYRSAHVRRLAFAGGAAFLVLVLVGAAVAPLLV